MTETPDRRIPGWVIVLGVTAILAVVAITILANASGEPV